MDSGQFPVLHFHLKILLHSTMPRTIKDKKREYFQTFITKKITCIVKNIPGPSNDRIVEDCVQLFAVIYLD